MPDPLHHFGYRFPAGCRTILALLALLATLAGPTLAPTQAQDPLAAEPAIRLPLILTWGHQSPAPHNFLIRLAGSHLTVSTPHLDHAEAEDSLHDGTARTRAGGGDVDGLVCELRFEPRTIHAITNAQSIWNHLFQHGNTEATRRLQSDPAFRPDPRQLTVHLDDSGTRGFTLSVDQLLTQKSFWLPELDLFLTSGTNPPSFAEFQAQREPRRGQRVLDRLATEPEGTYAQYTARWEDMGHPGFRNPHSIPPGHIVGIGWDSGLYKFGVDRLARVHHDYAKADQFELGLDFGGPEPQLEAAWQSQRLAEGLPILTTTFEKEGVRCDIEQFAYPLDGPPSERRGDIKMVLLQQTTLTELRGTARTVPLRIAHGRALSRADSRISARVTPTRLALEDELGQLLLGVEGPLISPETTDVTPAPPEREKASPLPLRRHQVLSSVALAARGTVVLTLRLPSPTLAAGEQARLFALDYLACRTATAKFWNDQLAQGAHFEVPEQAVNTLFRANLWHARRLPRRHGGPGPEVKIDLPYSNFAYDQFGTPWPVNQSVYVDYMLYDLRGHHALSAEEHAAIYRNNQETNGHVGGFANWGVYSPGMLYSVAQHALLSGDRASFERLLPATLRALDWCLGEMRRAREPGNPAPGLVLAPLNDLSHDRRSWAFNQAYFVAGVDLLGRALAEIQHPRAAECRAAAQSLRTAVEREFARASVRSPAVPLADGTWSPYVPCDAQASGRMFQSWYPTDVDTGPLHLARLKAIDPRGPLTTAMLLDHEDNLLLNQWGMINEPVYNQHATAYLLRDEPKAAIRAFYSMMACAFSHSVFEPVEHRWGWGQYFGPPSTDGAWFELYRQLLIQERDDDTLLLAQATPRAWLEEGQRILVQRAPTYYGPLSFSIESQVRRGTLTATLDLPERRSPAALLLRLRHPQSKPIRSVQVDRQPWTDFEPGKEWVRLPRPAPGRHVITAQY